MGDEKLHAVVARSTCPSQKCRKLTVSDHFWKLRCRKSARRCGAKQISKPKVYRADGFGPLLDVYRFCFVWQVQGFCTLSKVSIRREGFVPVSTTTTTLHYTTLHYTTLHYTTLHYTTTTTTLITSHHTTLHYTILHSTTLHTTSLQCTYLHDIQ